MRTRAATARIRSTSRRICATDNLLVVAIDNRPGMFTIPGFGARGAPDAWYDWWAYGGIVRDVWLAVHGPVRIERQFIRSKLDGANATVTNRVTLASRGARRGKLRATVTDPKGASAARTRCAGGIEGRRNEIPLTIRLSDIKRWDLDHPNLYRMNRRVARRRAARRSKAPTTHSACARSSSATATC